MSFQQLSQNINKALVLCGYKEPTAIQAQAIPIILDGKDVIACSETGSGKTAAFVLPALHHLETTKFNKKTRILILTPTRELANQINKIARQFSKFSRLNIISLVGGMPYGPQIRDLSRGADIIVATPGRLRDHIENNRVDLSHIEMLILDEADRMLDMGFIEDVEYIASLTPTQRQTLLFSATVNKQIKTIIKHLLKNPVHIDLSQKKIAPTQIKQQLYRVNSPKQKTQLLKHMLKNDRIYKAIIFSATKIKSDELADQIRNDGFSVAALHGDLRQKVRVRTLEQLRAGKIQFLVATDVAARGIDIDDVSHVINYDLPKLGKDYVHRIGRTGRAGRAGTAISFVLPSEQRSLKSIEQYIGQSLQILRNAEYDDNFEFDQNVSSKKSKKKKKFGNGHGHGDFQFSRKNSSRNSSRDSDRDDDREYSRKSSSRNSNRDSDQNYDREYSRKSSSRNGSNRDSDQNHGREHFRKSSSRNSSSRDSDQKHGREYSRKSSSRNGSSRDSDQQHDREHSRKSKKNKKPFHEKAGQFFKKLRDAI